MRNLAHHAQMMEITEVCRILVKIKGAADALTPNAADKGRA